MGEACHQLVKRCALRVNGNSQSAAGVYRRIAHLMLLKLNIKRFAKAGMEAASARKKKPKKNQAEKKPDANDMSDSNGTSESDEASEDEASDNEASDGDVDEEVLFVSHGSRFAQIVL